MIALVSSNRIIPLGWVVRCATCRHLICFPTRSCPRGSIWVDVFPARSTGIELVLHSSVHRSGEGRRFRPIVLIFLASQVALDRPQITWLDGIIVLISLADNVGIVGNWAD